MSGRATGWVLRHGPKNRAQRAVLIVIADAADQWGESSFPGTARIIDESGYKRSTVFRAIADMIEAGHLEVVERGRGRGHATVYGIPGVRKERLSTGKEKVQQMDLFQEERSRKSNIKVPIAPLSLITTTVCNNEHLSESEEFDQFWRAYPRPVGVAGARSAWAAALERASPDRILEGLRRYVRSPDLPAEVRFIPYPAAWLANERWEDGAPPLVAAAALKDCPLCDNSRWVPSDEGDDRMTRCSCMTTEVG